MTTHQLRKQIEVYLILETEDTINIDYWKGDQQKHLIVDRQENTNLMQFVDGKVSQWDAINMVCAHEMDCWMVQRFDMASTVNPENN